MKAVEFCYWLQGYFEIHGREDSLTEEQVSMIKRHLALVFKHEIDQSYGDSTDELKLLQEVHDGDDPTRTLSDDLPNPLTPPHSHGGGFNGPYMC